MLTPENPNRTAASVALLQRAIPALISKRPPIPLGSISAMLPKNTTQPQTITAETALLAKTTLNGFDDERSVGLILLSLGLSIRGFAIIAVNTANKTVNSANSIPICLSKMLPTKLIIKDNDGVQENVQRYSACLFPMLPPRYSSRAVKGPKGTPPHSPSASTAASVPQRGISLQSLFKAPLCATKAPNTEKTKSDGTTLSPHKIRYRLLLSATLPLLSKQKMNNAVAANGTIHASFFVNNIISPKKYTFFAAFSEQQ